MHKHNLRRNPAFKGRRYLPPHVGLLNSRPPSVDLRHLLPGVFDQGEEGSCGPNSADGFMCFLHPEVQGGFSRQQIYYCVREVEHDVGEDGGVETEDLFNILRNVGAAPEKLWPYTPEDLTTPPPADVLSKAAEYRIDSYSQLVSEEDFLTCLANGFPFILGFEVYDCLEGDAVAKSGVMPRPNPLAEKDLGGHDVLVVGYDTNFLKNHDFLKSGVDQLHVSNTALLIRNSWGADWGLNGHFWMPIDFASNASTGGDAWTGRI